MAFKELFGILAVVAGLTSFLPYLRDIFRKKTTPHIYSWLVWSILQITGVIAMISGDAGYGSLGLAMGALVSIVVFILAFKYGTRNITKFDTVCLIGALVAILVWIFQKDAFYSVILITVIDFVGFLPTYRKGYFEPNSETAMLYFMSAVSNIFAILSIANYSVVTTLYVASLVATNGFIVTLLLVRRRMRRTLSF